MSLSRTHLCAVAPCFALLLTSTSAWSQDKDWGAVPPAGLIQVLQDTAAPTFDKVRACQQLTLVGGDEAVPALASLLADEKLAAYARTALEAIPTANAAAALRNALDQGEGELLLGVIHSLGARRDAQSVNRLTRFLETPTSPAATHALTALGQIASDEAVDAIRKTLASGPEALRPAAADACLRAAQRRADDGKSEDAVVLYDGVSQADVPQHLRMAALNGAILARGTAGLPLLLEQLRADDKERFQVALATANKLAGVEVTQALLGELERLPPARQALLILALGDRGDAAIVPTLVRLAGNGEPAVRLAAIRVLGGMGNASTVPVLLEAALAADADVARTARASLVALNAAADDAIAEALRREDPKVRAVVLEIVGQRATVSALPTILQAADDPDLAVRVAAIAALGRTIDLDQLSVLTKRLAAAGAPPEAEAVRTALKLACKRMPDEDACAKTLAAIMETASPELKCFLLDLLRSIGSAESLKAVAAAARDADETVQNAATQALGEWMTAEAAPALLELAQSHPNAKFRVRALRGYLRIARQMNLPQERQAAMCREAWPLAQRDEERKLIADHVKQLPPAAAGGAALPLFDGKTFNGWDRSAGDLFRIEDGAIVVGNLNHPIAQNEFVATTLEFANFDLRVKFKLVGKDINAGVQFRSRRVPNSSEMIGYQADLGPAGIWGKRAFWGDLYDESRRNRKLAEADQDALANVLKPDDWNDYRILCQARRIQIWINGRQTVDYTEPEENLEQTGIIGLQIHAGPPTEAWYKDIVITPLP